MKKRYFAQYAILLVALVVLTGIICRDTQTALTIIVGIACGLYTAVVGALAIVRGLKQ